MSIDELLKRKSKELNIDIIRNELSRNGDLHVLALRDSDKSYVVWTSYNTGEDKTSYVDFYNGKYDLTIDQAQIEYDRRFR